MISKETVELYCNGDITKIENKWYTNGEITKQFKGEPPEGWVKGRRIWKH